MRLNTEIFKVLSIIYHYVVAGIIRNSRPFLCFVTTKYGYGAVVSESSSGALALCQLYKKGIHSSRPSSLWVLHLLTQFFLRFCWKLSCRHRTARHLLPPICGSLCTTVDIHRGAARVTQVHVLHFYPAVTVLAFGCHGLLTKGIRIQRCS